MGRGDRTDLEEELPPLPLSTSDFPPIASGLELADHPLDILERIPDSTSLQVYLNVDPAYTSRASTTALVLRLSPNLWSTRIELDTITLLGAEPEAAIVQIPRTCHALYPSCGLPQPCLHQALYQALLRDDPASVTSLTELASSYATSAGANAATGLLHAKHSQIQPPGRQNATHLCDGLYVFTDTHPSFKQIDPDPCLAEAGRCYLYHPGCDGPAAVHSSHLASLPTLVETLGLLRDPRGRELIVERASTASTRRKPKGLALAHPPFTARYSVRPPRASAFPSLRQLTPDPSTLTEFQCNAQALVLDPGDPVNSPIPLACVAHRFCDLCRLPMPCRHPELSSLVDVLHADLASSRFGEPLIQSSFQHEPS